MSENEPVDGQNTALPGSGSVKPKKRRRSRKARWIVGVSIFFGAIVILIVASFVTAHFTSASSFCDSCHEMEPYYQSWQNSNHATAECRDCHIPPGTIPYIETKLGSFREIYVHFSSHPEAPLGVTRKIPNSSCVRCHTDLSVDFKLSTVTAVTFKHGGKHASIDCIRCHVRVVHRTVTPPVYQDPAEMSSCLQCHNGSIAPKECAVCHTAPHEKRGECGSCHDASGWGSAGENHPFALTGAHSTLTCTQCHLSKPGVELIAGTDMPKADSACNNCHEDKHGGLTDCGSCHTPTKWSNVDFKHPFELTDTHATLACSKCHVSKPGGEVVPGTQFPIPSPECVSCHGDNHGGLTDCTKCHTPAGWDKVDFTHPLKLIGTHATLACSKCHVSKPGGDVLPGTQFPAPTSTKCVGCHGDRHKGLTTCSNCHTPAGWKPANFTHPIVGDHGRATGISCVKCHPNGYGSHYCSCHGGNPPSD